MAQSELVPPFRLALCWRGEASPPHSCWRGRWLRRRLLRLKSKIEWCENSNRAFSVDLQIDGCTAAIRSGDQRSQKELASYFNSRGLAYRAKGDFDRAVADFDEAIRLEPKNALLFNARGVAYSAKRDYGRAMADFDEAIRLEPKGAAAFLNNRGLARHSMNDYDGAIADFDEVIRLAPNYALACYNRANAYRVKGDNDRAISDYTDAIR